MLDKNNLIFKFLEYVSKNHNRKKKREINKKVEKPLKHFLKYLGNDPYDLRGDKFICNSSNDKEQQAYEVFLDLWNKFLLIEGIVETDTSEEVPVLQQIEVKDEKVKTLDTDLSFGNQNELKVQNIINISVHAQVKLLRMVNLMSSLGVNPRVASEENYRDIVADDEQRAIQKLARLIYSESLLIKESNSNGRNEKFKYYYNSMYNLVLIQAVDSKNIVTIYESYLGQTIAEEILADKKRENQMSPILSNMKDSCNRLKELLDYRKSQIESLKEQKEILERSIDNIENVFNKNSKNVDRIINDKKLLSTRVI